jgi:hypothetical protein
MIRHARRVAPLALMSALLALSACAHRDPAPSTNSRASNGNSIGAPAHAGNCTIWNRNGPTSCSTARPIAPAETSAGTWPAHGRMKVATFDPVPARHGRFEIHAANGDPAVAEVMVGGR